jgi:DNA ligase (NAD+)
MDIDGLGEAVAEGLISTGKISKLTDIYKLTLDDFLCLNKFGQKRAANLINAINKSKTKSLSKLIFALGIRHIGQRASEVLAGVYRDMDSLSKASIAELVEIEEIGEVLAMSVREFFENPQAVQTIDDLKKEGLNMTEPLNQQASSGTLANKVFVLTGQLPTMTRQEASDLIKAHGGRVSSSVSKNTDFVLAGADGGSKLDKAKNLGVQIIQEQDLKGML